eukprot:jgi/Psemu1/47643/gm1.47643_g
MPLASINTPTATATWNGSSSSSSSLIIDIRTNWPTPHHATTGAPPLTSCLETPSATRLGLNEPHNKETIRLIPHIDRAMEQYQHSTSWGDFIRTIQGRGDLHKETGNLPHPAGQLLDHFRRIGTPAAMTDPVGPWEESKLLCGMAAVDSAPSTPPQAPPGLRLSPLAGLVPQRGRWPQMISDCTYFGVNKDTLPLALKDSTQFGRALQRLLTRLREAQGHHKAGCAVPLKKGKPPLIGIPLANPMGFKSSPPNSCACTETIVDIANATLAKGLLAQTRNKPHCLGLISKELPEASLTAPVPLTSIHGSTTPSKKPVWYWDVVFCLLDTQDTPFRQEPALFKKILKGGVTCPHQRTVSIQQWHKVLGELRSMALAIPGSLGLFFILQEAFRHQEPSKQRIPLTKRIHSFLHNFKNRPIRIEELVPNVFLANMGACDAPGTGMGGIHFVPNTPWIFN